MLRVRFDFDTVVVSLHQSEISAVLCRLVSTRQCRWLYRYTSVSALLKL